MKKITPPLVVPKPCHAEWGAMSGDERKRFCGECGKHVYNLSAMTEREAQRFADESKGSECVAYIRAGDEMISPNFFERFVLRIAGWKPAIGRVLIFLLPAALTSCVSTPPIAGGIRPPDKSVTPPQGRNHAGNIENGVLLGEPIPVPGTPAPVPKPGKVRIQPEK